MNGVVSFNPIDSNSTSIQIKGADTVNDPTILCNFGNGSKFAVNEMVTFQYNIYYCENTYFVFMVDTSNIEFGDINFDI